MENKRITVELDPVTQKALDDLSAMPMHAVLKTPTSGLVRLAITEYARLELNPSVKSATRQDVENVIARVTEAIANIKIKASKTIEPAETTTSGGALESTKPTRTATMEDEGRARCERMGGRVEGNSCIYTKYEVLASGRAVRYQVPSPLTSLSEADEKKQYDPSREAWEKANTES